MSVANKDMAKLSNDEVKQIAGLARLGMSEKEVGFYAEELSAILEYIEKLNEVDTKNVELTSHVTGLHSVFRKDEQHPQLAENRDDLARALIDAIPVKEKSFAKVRSVFLKLTNGLSG